MCWPLVAKRSQSPRLGHTVLTPTLVMGFAAGLVAQWPATVEPVQFTTTPGEFMLTHSNRAAVRPVLATALTLLVGVAVGAPSVASPPTGMPLPAPGAALEQGSASTDSVAGVSASGTIRVEVPRVAFGPSMTIASGHLRVAVLLSDPHVTGTASVIGADPRDGCAVSLIQGLVQVMDCALPQGATGAQTLAVTLSDGWQLVVSVP